MKNERNKMSSEKLTTKITTTVTKVHNCSLGKAEILQLLSQQLGKTIPSNATVNVRVPGGGDWSDMDLDIEESPVQVSWAEETTSEKKHE
jgi:hypothetical protein